MDIVTVSYSLHVSLMNTACTQGAIRLVGGANEMEGRVEVCNNNMWGTICDYGWDINDARVACWQSGFSSGRTCKSNHIELLARCIIV